MKETTKQELTKLVAVLRQHVAATEAALNHESLDVLFCVTDLMETTVQIGDRAKAEIESSKG